MNRYRKILRIIFLTISVISSGVSMTAQNKTGDLDPYTAGIEENLQTPSVPAKLHTAVVSAMGPLSRTLKNNGLVVKPVRDGEVLMVVLPCSDLFMANDTDLRPEGKSILNKLKPYVLRSDNYKVVVAVHSDDTGDNTYADLLTEARANSIDEFFGHENGFEGTIPYGLGKDEPVASNIGISNRARNRRVEIYFVPTKNFIDKVR